MLEFAAARHEYRLNGRVIPSVTDVLGILEDFSAVPADVLARAAEFGRHVHQACHLWDTGELDLETLDPALCPYLDSWTGYLEQARADVIGSEFQVVDAQLGYAGTADKLLRLPQCEALVDLKSTAAVPRTVGPQTAAYFNALDRPRAEKRRIKRYCIHLRPDGQPARAIALTDSRDWPVFQSCLNVWRFRHAA